MYRIEMLWGGTWVPLPLSYATRDDAEWAVARWKQANQMRGDPFRVLELAGQPWTVQEILDHAG